VKRVLSICIIVAVSALSLYANDVKSVLADLQRISTYQADFLQITEIEGFGEDEYSGRLYMNVGEQAIWDYSKPYRQFYLFDSLTMKYYDSDTRQLIVQRLDPATNVFMRLMLNPSDIQSDFDASLNGSELILKPKGDLGLDTITFTVEKGVVTEIKTKDQSGNNTRVILTKIVTDRAVDKKVFLPEIPENTEIFEYD